MKTLVCIILVCSISSAFAANKKNLQKRGTKFNFSGMSLNGKYLDSYGTSIKTEEDKSLRDILMIRKDFKDRVELER